MRIIDETTGKGLPTTLLTPEQLRTATGRTTTAVLRLLARHPEGMHTAAIARALGRPEQNIYYHTRHLQKAGILTVDHRDETRGGVAKILTLTTPSFSIAYQGLEQTTLYPCAERGFLEPFIVNGRWNARIVASSPDPHGPERASGRDTQFAVDIAMFFGSFLESPPVETLVFDTHLRNWRQNLIIIGGPIVNKAADRVNHQSPAPYDRETKSFTSRITNRTYGEEHVGIIVRMENPRASGKQILLIAGKRYTGTRAAILACTRHSELLHKPCTIVQGTDTDSDGTIDHVEILE